MSVHKYVTKTRGVQWEVRYRNPLHQDRRERPFRTQADALDWERKNVTAIKSGTYIDPAAGKITMAELWDKFLEVTTLAPKTMERHESTWRVRGAAKWAATPVRAIRPSDIQGWVNALRKEGRSDATVYSALDTLSALLRLAASDSMITTNPMEGVTRPDVQGARRNYLDHESIGVLADEVGRDYWPYGLVVWVLAYTGLRIGELSALRVRDVDHARRRLMVTDGAVEVKGRRMVGATKTRRAREVPIPLLLVDALADQCRGKLPDALLFTSSAGYPLSARRYLTRPWNQALARIQADAPWFPRVTPHGLRHAYASLTVSAGGNVKTLQRGLGHKSSAITHGVYVDLLDRDLDTMGDSLSAQAAAAGISQIRQRS